MAERKLGKAVLHWSGRRARLARDERVLARAGVRGPLGEKPLAVRRSRAILASRDEAVLADGGSGTLVAVGFAKRILAAAVVGDAALLAGRETAAVHAFAGGTRRASFTMGGSFRADTGIAAAGPDAAGLLFHDRLLVVGADGRRGEHRLLAGTALLRGLGRWVVAAARDRIWLVDGRSPSFRLEARTRGALRHDAFAAAGDLGAIPTRDAVYVLDGAGGGIAEVAPGGAVAALLVLKDRVRATFASRREPVEVDRKGDVRK